MQAVQFVAVVVHCEHGEEQRLQACGGWWKWPRTHVRQLVVASSQVAQGELQLTQFTPSNSFPAAHEVQVVPVTAQVRQLGSQSGQSPELKYLPATH